MELLKSLTVDSAPSILELFRFGLISSLQLLKSFLLLYPLNVFLLIIIVFLTCYKIAKMILPKPIFN